VVGEPFDEAGLTEDLARSYADRLGLRLSEKGELDFLLACGSVDVQAAPGSGKTSLTGVKLCMLSSVWKTSRQGICVLSHTNTAKEQIRSIVEQDTAGRRFLDYPHFIGTIQTFVDTFLALPYLRSMGVDVRSVDDDVYAVAACRAWKKRRDLEVLRRSLAHRRNGEELVGCACFRFEGGEVCVCPENGAWPFGSGAASTQQYERLKIDMQADGRFRYADMYAFAFLQLNQSPALAQALARRFPLLIIDEMQDTSELQQDILSAVFSPDSCVVQRIGDENQRIYDSGGADCDASFPDDCHIDLGQTRRFGQNIARVASALTIKSPQSITVPEDSPADHLVLILFDEQSAGCVIPAFERFVLDRVPSDVLARFPVKAVGARREAGTVPVGGISNFGVNLPLSAAHRPIRSLADAVGRTRHAYARSGNTFGCWKSFLAALLELVVLNGFRIDDRRPTARRFERWLDEQDGRVQPRLRAMARHLIFSDEMAQPVWESVVSEIERVLCDITGATEMNDEAKAFLAFNSEAVQSRSANAPATNPPVRVTTQVDTIHNVKGETHAATLVLECKDSTGKMNDLKEVIGLLSGEMGARRKSLPTVQRICQLAFVAATRPVTCLGFAAAKADAAQHVAALEAAGWVVVDVTKTPQPHEPHLSVESQKVGRDQALPQGE
jgi:DNA helicase-2/ATP-dependent DNA helicase PcrA